MRATGEQATLFPAADVGGSTAPIEPIPELPPEDGYLAVTKTNLNSMSRRITPLQVLVVERIACRTTSARKLYKGGPRPRFADVTITELQQFTGASVRLLCSSVAHLEKIRYIERERPNAETHRGGMRVLAANFRSLPVKQPKAPRHRVRTASAMGPREEAALRQTPVMQPQSQPATEANTGRMVFTEEAKHAVVQAMAKSQELHTVAGQAAAPQDAQRPVTQPAATPSADPMVQNFSPVDAEVLRAQGFTSATCCPHGWLCPVIDRASDTPAVQNQNQNQSNTDSVGKSVPHSPTDPPQETAAPEEPELASLRVIVEGTGIHKKLLQPITRDHLVAWNAALAGAQQTLLARSINARWRKDKFGERASLNLILYLARDIGKVWAGDHPEGPGKPYMEQGSWRSPCCASGVVISEDMARWTCRACGSSGLWEA